MCLMPGTGLFEHDLGKGARRNRCHLRGIGVFIHNVAAGHGPGIGRGGDDGFHFILAVVLIVQLVGQYLLTRFIE